jgi:hypothetical protein
MADDDVGPKALQLLRLLNEHTAKGLTDLPVRPDEQMVADAGLGHRGSDLHDAAIKWLLGEEALQLDLQSRGVGSDSPPGEASNHGTAFFNITLHGLQLLRQEEDR